MRTYLLNLWDSFRGSFWFKPTLMVLFAILLAEGSNWIDARLGESETKIGWLSTTAEASRSTLTAVASATIALAGVVFSITILSLSIASNQFGSRLVRSVMGHTIADWVIGQYIGTALFCLLVLRTVREEEYAEQMFVPYVGTGLGVVLGLISMWMLIWFTHHVATAIQAPNLVGSVSNELDTTIDQLFPTQIGRPQHDEEDDERSASEILSKAQGECVAVPADCEGYVEGIDGESLIAHAQQHKGVLKLTCKPGNFITFKDTLAEFYPYEAGTLQEEEQKAFITSIRKVILIGRNRSPRQDVSYATLQLVEMAVRALSPGINDPFTAMSCIDRMSGALCTLAERDFPEIIRRDEEGTPRVILTNIDRFPEVLNDAFNMVRQNGTRSVAVSIRLLDALIRIAPHISREQDREAMQHQAAALQAGFDKQEYVEADRNVFKARCEKLQEVLDS